ncbi:MAG TPA: glycosyltransferase family 2 protein [Luteolibacter sp.]
MGIRRPTGRAEARSQSETLTSGRGDGSCDLTIITVCRNAAATIERTFRSVASQKTDNHVLDYWVVDGASTDKTLSLVQKWADAGLVTHWLSEPDHGIYDAMNKAIALKPRGYVLFLNADDELPKGTLDRVINASRNHPPYIFGDAEIVEGDEVLAIQQGDELELVRLVLCNHQALWVRADWLERLGGFRTDIGLAADLDFMWRLRCAVGSGIKAPGLLSRFHRGGSSATGYESSLLQVQLIHSNAIRDWCAVNPRAKSNFLLGWSKRVAGALKGRNDLAAQDLIQLYREATRGVNLDAVERITCAALVTSLASSKSHPYLRFCARLLRNWEHWNLKRHRETA